MHLQQLGRRLVERMLYLYDTPYLDSHDIIRPASMRYTSFLAEAMIASDRLFEFDHLADARLVALVQPYQIDPSGDGLPQRVSAIPRELILTSALAPSSAADRHNTARPALARPQCHNGMSPLYP